MSVAAQRIQVELGLTNVEIGWVLSAFILGYAIPQFPVGVIVDRLGPYRVLLVSAFAWSFWTLVTAGVRWLPATAVWAALIAGRFLAGIGQAGLLSCSIKTVGHWMPLRERATANGLFMMGLGLGGGFAPPLIVRLVAAYGWPAPFLVFGLAGLVLAFLWRTWGSSGPEGHARVNRAELEYIRSGMDMAGAESPPGIPWRTLFRNRSVVALALSYGVAGYTSYVFFTWFFLYVVNVRKVDTIAGGWWTSLPYAAVAAGTVLGGRASDLLTARLGKRAGRLLVVLTGELLAAFFLLAGARVEDASAGIVLLALAAGSHLFSQAPSWTAATDLAPHHAGMLFGAMNTMAQVAGAISPVATPAIAARFGWIAALDFAAAMVLASACLWLFVDPRRPAYG